jgi:hypothetical protein
MIGCGFLAAAVASAVLVGHELRAVAVDEALSVAEASGASAERRDEALSRADSSLAWGAPTGALRELAAARALVSEPPDLDKAEKLSWAALERSPGRADAWTRLAYVDVIRHGALTPQGLSDLALSYKVAPFGPESLRHWRVEFVLSRWDEVGDDLRDAALREAHAATVGGTTHWWEETQWMYGLASRLSSPAREKLEATITRDKR